MWRSGPAPSLWRSPPRWAASPEPTTSSPSSTPWCRPWPELYPASQGANDELPRGHGAAASGLPPSGPDPTRPGPACIGPGSDLRGPRAGADRRAGSERGVSARSGPARPQHVLLVLWLHAAGGGPVQFPVGSGTLRAAGGLHRNLVRGGDGRHIAVAVERSPWGGARERDAERRGARLGDLEGRRDHGDAVCDRRDVPVHEPAKASPLFRRPQESPADWPVCQEVGLSLLRGVRSRGHELREGLGGAGGVLLSDRPGGLLDAAGPERSGPTLLGLGDRVRDLRPRRGFLLPQGLADGCHHRVPV